MTFRVISPWRRLLELAFPPLRRRRARRLRAAIDFLMDHPEIPFKVDE
jgi:hypothetical protein